MKYWKQFWGSLNLGWKRIHYVGLPVFYITVYNWEPVSLSDDEAVLFVLSTPVFYFLLITAIYWIKEGFQSKEVEPTKEDK
jgi:hypothetical protein